jgi:prepilin-type N-terminal cleavage/methylation domain-containing protein
MDDPKMNTPVKRIRRTGFTLVEVLVVIAVMGILASLLLPALTAAKARTKRATCLNNLRQINLGLRMYVDDSTDTLPAVGGTTNFIRDFSGYKELMKEYVGLRGATSHRDRLFACPADTFYYEFSRNDQTFLPRSAHDQPEYGFSSYWMNAGTLTPFRTNSNGLGGRKIGPIRNPARTILVAEMPAFFPWSWHQPKRPLPMGHEWPIFNNAQDVVSFVDGHVSFVKMFWDVSVARTPCPDPPPEYEYQWSGN